MNKKLSLNLRLKLRLRHWHGLFVVLIFFPVMNFFFMNCAGGLYSSYQQSFFSAYDYGADLVWSAKDSSAIFSNDFDQIETWNESTNDQMGLYPPLRAGGTSLDFEKAPLTGVTNDQISFLNFKDKKQLRSLTENLRTLLSERYSVGFFINSVDILTAANSFTRVFDLYSPNGVSDGYVGVDVTSTQVKVFYWFNSDSQHWLMYDVTTEDLQKGLAVLVRVGPDYESVALSVNGKMATKSYTSPTPPPRLAYVSRQLRINPEFTDSGGFHLYELAIWIKSLSDQTLKDYSQGYYNSYVLGISAGIGNPGGEVIDDDFAQVLTVLNKSRASGSCLSCHGAVSQESGFLAARSATTNTPWVTLGNAQDSLVIKAIRRKTGVVAMPPSGRAIPESEIQVIENYINNSAQ